MVVIICLQFTGLVSAEQDPVTAGKDALDQSKLPWYNADEDSVQIVSLDTETDAGDRKNKDEKGQRASRSGWFDWEWDWGSGGGGGGGFRIPSFGEVMQFLGWVILLLVLGGLIYALIRTFLSLEPNAKALQRNAVLESEEVRTDEQRIQELPMQPQKKEGDFLSNAKSSYDAGQYAEAIVYLFSHRLLQLDRAGFIRLTRGKTNRQYLFEVTKSNELRSILGQTIVCFEDVFFGQHELSKSRFEATWSDNTQFDSIIRKVLQ